MWFGHAHNLMLHCPCTSPSTHGNNRANYPEKLFCGLKLQSFAMIPVAEGSQCIVQAADRFFNLS